MKKLITFLIVCMAGTFVFGQDSLPVVPQPQEVTLNGEAFSLELDAYGIKVFADDPEEVSLGVDEVKAALERFTGATVSDAAAGEAHIIAGLRGDDEFEEICEQAGIDLSRDPGEEGYQLVITSDRIVLEATAPQGLYYGFQTIEMLIRARHIDDYIPGAVVYDFPVYKYRGVMDDISRGPIPTMDFVKYQIRRFADLKLNYFTHYVEHVVKTEQHPKFAPPDGSFTIEEWKEIVAYASKYYMTTAGNFQSFGHFAAILETPEYAHLGESGSLISPVHPESIPFLRDVYEEMVPAFTADWFPVNCDETFDLGKGASKETVEKYGYAKVYYDHVMNIYDELKELGTVPMIWGDIMLQYPELFEMFPKDIMMGTWTYDGKESFDEYIEPFIEHGYELFVTPGVLNSSRVMPVWDQTLTNQQNFVRDGAKHGAIGVVNTVWDDGGFAFFSLDWYGVAYSADVAWQPRELPREEYDNRFLRAVYADTSNGFTRGIWKLMELVDYTPTDNFSQKPVWMKMIPDSGEALNLSYDDWNDVLRILDEAEAEFDQASFYLNQHDIEYFYFIIELYRFMYHKIDALIASSADYRYAVEVFPKDRFEAREHVLNALYAIADAKVAQIVLMDHYQDLWLYENHTYALDRITDRFKVDAVELADIEHRLFEALRQLDTDLPLPAPETVRMTVGETSGKYFREWMMINPVPNADGLTASQVDYLEEMGGEVNAQPKVTQEFYFDGEKYRWRRVETPYYDIVDLGLIFPETNENVVQYAHSTITAEEAMEVTAAVGSDEGVTVFINGEVVYQNDAKRDFVPDEDTFKVQLKEGKNHLLIKSTQSDGTWAFTFRLPENKLKSRKNRYYILE